MNETVGERIRAARAEKKLTQKELAQQVGIPYQTLQFWENGKRNPKIDNLQRVADALDVDVNWLLRGVALCEQQAAFAGHTWKNATGGAQLAALNGLFDSPKSAEPLDLPSLEEQLLAHFRTLNPRGQQVAVERLGELVQLPAYRAAEATSPEENFRGK